MSSRICKICGRKEARANRAVRSSFFAKFPLDEDRCKEWVRAVGDEELVHVPIEKLHQLCFICGDHFENKHFNKKKSRLKKFAVPTLRLSAPPLTDLQLSDYPQHIGWKSKTVPEHQKAPSLLPPTSTKSIAAELFKIPELEMAPLLRPSTSKQSLDDLAPERQIAPSLPPSTSTKSIAAEPFKTPEHQIAPSLPSSTSIKSIAVETFKIPELEMAPLLQPSTSKQSLADLVPELEMAPLLQPSTSKQSLADLVPELEMAPLLQPSTSKQSLADLGNTHSGPDIKSDGEDSKRFQRKRKSNDDIELTPRKKKLLNKLRKTRCSLNSLRKSAKLLEKIESPVLKEIVESAIKNQKRKPQGRRWSTQNKISALGILKRSPKVYRHMQQLIPLPSEKTLQNLLKKIPMEPGINQATLNHLKKIAPKKTFNDKLCVLAFDEIAIKPHLQYNPATDKVEGYVDYGNPDGRGPEIADHALVFLLQGLRKKFKQPLAYYFVKGTVSSQKLAELIKANIIAVSETGFKVLATVCDQGPTNIGAMKVLKQQEMTSTALNNHIVVGGEKVFTLYDVPHLFKSIRNNFFNHGVMVLDGKKAKWEHLKEVEAKNRAILYLSKISKTHVEPKFRAKMRVKYAAQALSNTVAAVLKLMAEADTDRYEELMATAHVVQELNKLFDFSNGPANQDDIKKGIRENVSSKTNHLNVWSDFRKRLENVKFYGKGGSEAKHAKCIGGYIMTLSALQDIWHYVSQHGFKYLNLRQLNQDSLENLFGIIRQSNPNDRNPTCSSFASALKSNIVAGFTAYGSRSTNCQRDNNELLTNFHDIVFGTTGQDTEEVEDKENAEITEAVEGEGNLPVLHLPECEDTEEANFKNIEYQPVVYVSGYIARLLQTHNCVNCQNCLKAQDPENVIYRYIQLREYWEERKCLSYPALPLCKTVESSVSVFEKEIVPVLHKHNVGNLTVTVFSASCDSEWLTCSKHKNILLNTLFLRLAHLLVRRQCQRLNEPLIQQSKSLDDAQKRAQQIGL